MKIASSLVLLALVLLGPPPIQAPDKPDPLIEKARVEKEDKAAFQRAIQLFAAKKFDESKDALLALIATGRENQWVGRARLGLAEVYQKLGDEKAMLQQLEVAAGAPATPTDRNLMDTSDTRQEAVQRIARHHFQKGNFKESLAAYKRWEPESWCGTCLMGMHMHRQHMITVCRLNLGEHAAVAQELLDYVTRGHDAPHNAELLFRLYDDAGQMDDILRLLGGKVKLGAPSHHEAVLHKLAAGKDIAGLIKLCVDPSRRVSFLDHPERAYDWERLRAAETLAALIAEDITPVVNAIAKTDGSTSWLLYALGKSGSTKALDWLADRAARDVDVRGDARNYLLAISFHGDAGRKVLERLAADGNEDAHTRAKALSETPPARREWPAPARGSLGR